MAIDFLKAQKRQRYLILILAVAIFAALLIVWLGFLRKPNFVPSSSSPTANTSKIEIKWETLKGAALEKMKTFQDIPPFDKKVGRENPFAPY